MESVLVATRCEVEVGRSLLGEIGDIRLEPVSTCIQGRYNSTYQVEETGRGRLVGGLLAEEQ